MAAGAGLFWYLLGGGMFQTICDLIPADADCSVRGRRLSILRRVLEGTFYDALPYEFHGNCSPW